MSGFIVLFIWFAALAFELHKRLPKKIELPDFLFYVHLMIIFVLFSIFYLFAEPGQRYGAKGLFPALGLLMVLIYLLIAFVHIYNHLSKLLTYVEEEREVEFSKRVGEMVLFFFFFIGIWWLQPRIIKALEKPEIVYEKYISIREIEAMNNSKENK